MTGRLFLVPNLLGIVSPEQVLPAATLQAARAISHWLVETAKPARAFLKAVDPARPVGGLSIREFANASDIDELLAPLAGGHDVGLLSDAGCPGIADPGADVVSAAHARGARVVPLVGPSSIVLALMASGMNGQRFDFHGYLPAATNERNVALRMLEQASQAEGATQLFIETPYRNVAMLKSLIETLKPATRLCVAVDLTLPTESVISKPMRKWRNARIEDYAKRPAMFVVQA
ncbi:MAG TPA: SAM-dependent methyltransferase [Casimicrobiaceae bacterium]|nr:SAM-dependent methyltransferase [Casimicrobiaceae bacterium]